jgi:hypothetical protein
MHLTLQTAAFVVAVVSVPVSAAAEAEREPRSRIAGPDESIYSHGIRPRDGMPGERARLGGDTTVDTNDNGIVSDSEAARYFWRYFASIDTDDDGEVTLREFPLVFYGPGPTMKGVSDEPDRWQKRKEARFAKIDANDDGTVTQSEFVDYGESEYRKSDRNDNGEVTIWEFLARRHF